MYKILPYSFEQAKKLNVLILPSTKSKYKIDVYSKDLNYICSIGDKNYLDYPTYIKEYGLEYANIRRKLYKKRHESDRNKIGTCGYFADKILW